MTVCFMNIAFFISFKRCEFYKNILRIFGSFCHLVYHVIVNEINLFISLYLFSTMGGPQQDAERAGGRRRRDPPPQAQILLQRRKRGRQVPR